MDQNKLIYDLLEQRDKRPQRSLEIRALAPLYVLSADETLRIRFQQALAKFTENLPFDCKEEKNPRSAAALREQMENFQAYADPANYRQMQVENGIRIWLEFPEHIKVRNEAKLASMTGRQRVGTLLNWSRKTIEVGRVADGMTLEEAVRSAKESCRPDDFSRSRNSHDIQNSMRLEAIAGTAAAILITALDWAKENNHFDWCRETLLMVARAPANEDGFGRSRSKSDPKISAGRGLGMLITGGTSDDKVREQVLRLVADPKPGGGYFRLPWHSRHMGDR